MNRLMLLIGLAPFAFASPTLAQGHSQHGGPAADPHAGHVMPPPAANPHAGHGMPAAPPAADPHAGHVMPPPPADPHAGHAMPAAPPAADPHAGHDMSAMPADTSVGNEPAPPAPKDRAAERFYSAEAMAAARAQLALEHGGGTAWKVMLSTAELRPQSGDDGYGWEGEAWYGGDEHRLVLKSQGEGVLGGDLHSAEVQALYSRPIGPYFDWQAGVRRDFEPGPSRTYATLGFEGVAPYWFELEGAAFLSEKGDLSARFEGSYDFRLTQKLILEPRAELSLAAQEVRELGIGSGVTDAEVGLRLRYEVRREFGPYIGVMHERKFGETADLAREAGEDRESTTFVVGVRAWF